MRLRVRSGTAQRTCRAHFASLWVNYLHLGVSLERVYFHDHWRRRVISGNTNNLGWGKRWRDANNNFLLIAVLLAETTGAHNNLPLREATIPGGLPRKHCYYDLVLLLQLHARQPGKMCKCKCKTLQPGRAPPDRSDVPRRQCVVVDWGWRFAFDGRLLYTTVVRFAAGNLQ